MWYTDSSDIFRELFEDKVTNRFDAEGKTTMENA